MTRLSTGELERRILDVLWSTSDGMTSRQVHSVVSAERDLAYTTVMTILVRLWRKGVVERVAEGRAYRYTPRTSREEHTAERMRQLLAAATDADAALSHFVQGLDPKKRRQLRRLLGGGR